MQKFVLCFAAIWMLATLKVGAQGSFGENAKKYIAQYSTLAMLEQRERNIPAAITLGQGILETEAGTSELVTNANNHFGIKCNNGWVGETYTYTDDAPDECFKKYKCAEDSYRDHSDHLRKNGRYSSLFTLQQSDYKGWAKGLKKAGYATNPLYAERLIAIIETYGLEQFTKTADDTSVIIKPACTPAPLYTHALADSAKKTLAAKDTVKNKPAAVPVRTDAPRIVITHDRHTVLQGETVASISQLEGVTQKQIMDYNFLYPNEEPEAGSVLELQKQARHKPEVWINAMPAHKENAIVGTDDKTAGKSDDYVVINKSKPADNHISQTPVVTPAPVPESNPVAAPVSQTAASTAPAKPRYSRQVVKNPEPHAEEEDPRRDQQLASLKAELDKVVYADDSKLITEQAGQSVSAPQPKQPQKMIAANDTKFYTVKQGDTAFSIARKNNITLEQLKAWNGMQANNLKPGQKLRIK